jgi:hypothetical protein
MVVVGGLAEIDPALRWLTTAGRSPYQRVTFVHVVDTSRMYGGLEFAGMSLAGLVVDAECDGNRLLERLRGAAPATWRVTTRLLMDVRTSADQILRAVAEDPCDAIVICSPLAITRWGAARMVRRLRSRSPVPVFVLQEAQTAGFSFARLLEQPKDRGDDLPEDR